VIARVMLARFVFVFVFLLAFAIMAGSRIAAEGSSKSADARPTPVTRQEVWQAVVAGLKERGLSEPQMPRIEDLDLPVAVPAVAGRKLRASSSCWDDGSERAEFRMECSEPGQCLPFLAYVQVHRHDGGGEDAGTHVGLCRLASVSRPAGEAPPTPLAKPTVRPGDQATAVFLSARLRITASVTCLDRGREGEIIRVRNQDGEIFRARVSGPALLEALPQ
jgi:flagellar basal body P-ring formation chaperone FlgA